MSLESLPGSSPKPVETSIDNQTVENDGAESCISYASFNQQLNEVSQIELKTESGVSQQSTYTEINPERLSNENPIVFVGGIRTTATSYDAQLLALAQRGRRIIFVNPGAGIMAHGEFADYADSKNTPATIQDKAYEVHLLLQNLGVEHFDLIGHSQGGAVSSLLTAYDPSKVRKLILDTPVGLTDLTSLSKIAVRGMLEIRREYVVERERLKLKKAAQNESSNTEMAAVKEKMRISLRVATRMAALDFFHKCQNLLKKLPPLSKEEFVRRSIEIMGISQANIISLLEDIQNQNRSQDELETKPEVTLLTAQSDKIIKANEMEALMSKHGLGGLTDSWVMYIKKEAGHGKVTRHDPELIRKIAETSLDSNASAPGNIGDVLAQILGNPEAANEPNQVGKDEDIQLAA